VIETTQGMFDNKLNSKGKYKLASIKTSLTKKIYLAQAQVKKLSPGIKKHDDIFFKEIHRRLHSKTRENNRKTRSVGDSYHSSANTMKPLNHWVTACLATAGLYIGNMNGVFKKQDDVDSIIVDNYSKQSIESIHPIQSPEIISWIDSLSSIEFRNDAKQCSLKNHELKKLKIKQLTASTILNNMDCNIEDLISSLSCNSFIHVNNKRVDVEPFASILDDIMHKEEDMDSTFDLLNSGSSSIISIIKELEVQYKGISLKQLFTSNDYKKDVNIKRMEKLLSTKYYTPDSYNRMRVITEFTDAWFMLNQPNLPAIVLVPVTLRDFNIIQACVNNNLLDCELCVDQELREPILENFLDINGNDKELGVIFASLNVFCRNHDKDFSSFTENIPESVPAHEKVFINAINKLLLDPTMTNCQQSMYDIAKEIDEKYHTEIPMKLVENQYHQGTCCKSWMDILGRTILDMKKHSWFAKKDDTCIDNATVATSSVIPIHQFLNKNVRMKTYLRKAIYVRETYATVNKAYDLLLTKNKQDRSSSTQLSR